ncbi:proline iminopeptidase [Pseudarcicella hirudinis]|uniref:Proline iminopeptidase n=1 Tax=Pseudarcicella hirudinis TaxID=1079859 RepID=A0A1I5Y956_9BACT|nr:alpha/beta hydrolase [Pseudarcicella hirudinis]SFQ40772.1 proline iminopeptidase [Pseudarcicella hirudinis]
MKKLMTAAFLLIVQLCAFAQQEGYVDNGDFKTFYRTYGKGDPLLIINGGPGMNSDGFVEIARKLSANNRTIIYDQRGTGRSVMKELNSSNMTVDLMVDDLERLRKSLRIDKWTILGHSFGGMLASYYATKFPEHISALILSSSGGIDLDLLAGGGGFIAEKLSRQEQDSLAYWSAKIEEGDTSYHARLRRGLALAPAYVYDKKNIPVIAERLTQSNSRITGLVWQNLQNIKFNCEKGLLSFNKPVLIIQGKQDIVSEKLAEKAHKVLKNSKVVLMDKCVHYGWLDNPEVYFSSVNKFLSSI